MQKEEIRLVRLGDIQPHPLNNFFFDDIVGEKWDDFKRSLQKGLIERPILTDSLMIVSGHQRLRGLKENGASEDEMVSCVIRTYNDENEILRELIDTNIQQRGTISCSAVKLGRIACALEEIYGVRVGNPRRKSNQGSSEASCKSQTDIAEMLDENMETYRRNKKLAQLPPEIQDMIERGQITPSTGARLIARMDEASQQKLVQMLPTNVVQCLTQAEVQQYIEKINTLQDRLEIVEKASGETEEWLKLSSERDAAKEKARQEYERAASMQRELKSTEKRLEKAQADWAFEKARADGSMLEGSPFVMIDSALNSFIRSMAFIQQTDQCLSGLNHDQLKYIYSLLGKSMQMAREVALTIKAA